VCLCRYLEVVAGGCHPGDLDDILGELLIIHLSDISLLLRVLAPLGHLGGLEDIHERVLIDGYLVHLPSFF